MSSITPERIAKLRDLCERATPAPWNACGQSRGGCTCCQVWSESVDAPVAKADIGEWGDEFPTLRIDPSSSIKGKVEVQAVMDMLVYGEIPKERAIANAAFIAEARQAIPDLLDALEEMANALCLHEEWEADVILDARWDTDDGLPHLRYCHMDALNAVQEARNAALRMMRQTEVADAG